jgi:hypothetical protein
MVRFSSDPKKVMKRKAAHARHFTKRLAKKEGYRLCSMQQLLQESVPCGLIGFTIMVPNATWDFPGNKIVRNWVLARLV